jgi:hypothetical protein
MEKRSLLRTMLRMGRPDSALESAPWKRLLLTVASVIFLLGLVLLITKFANIYLRLTALTFIFFSLGGFVIVFTSLFANRSYRTLPIVIGMLLAGLMFLLGFAFFFISFQY